MPLPSSPDHEIIILGAGIAGVGLAARLKALGREDFVVLEKTQAVGGAWRDNTYPGCACDTESHLYSYSFSPHPQVSRLYARQPELLAYVERIAAAAGLAAHIRFGCEVTAAAWDDAGRLWRLTLATGEALTSRVFVAAWGQLNRPSIPAIEGQESFGGESFHSARWRHDIDLTGKRVASIGSAASAIQYIPEITPRVAHLDVFQRSPNWIVPRGDRPYTPQELEGFMTVPGAFEASREALFAWRETTFQRMREGSDEAHELEAQARAHLANQVADPGLRARLTPDFPLGCKRVLRSDDFFPALMRDNVALVTEPIARIAPEGIVTRDGRLHPLDVIIYGTGFETQSFQGPVEIHGANGVDLRQVWAGAVRAYLGMTVAGFPNFFMLYGPNTNLGHNSILSMLEAQIGYLLQALELLDRHATAMAVRPEVLEAFDRKLQAEMDGSAWAGSCNSWYKNAQGRVVNNWSGPVATYQAATARLDPGDFMLLDARRA